MREIRKGQAFNILLRTYKSQEITKILIALEGQLYTCEFFTKGNTQDGELFYPDALSETHNDEYKSISSHKEFERLISISEKERYRSFGSPKSLCATLTKSALYNVMSTIFDEWFETLEKESNLTLPCYIYNVKAHGSNGPIIPFVDVSHLDIKVVGLI